MPDERFHPLWRNKLRVSDRPQRIFDAVREVIDATNILAGKTRRALDSTVLDDAVIRQDAIMQLVARIRRVRRLVPAAKALVLVAHDYDNDTGKPVCAWNDRAEIDRVVTELVNDATMILVALDGVELDDVQTEAVDLLALVAGQDVEPGDTDGTWRIAQETSPDRMVSVHDPESRHVPKPCATSLATAGAATNGPKPATASSAPAAPRRTHPRPLLGPHHLALLARPHPLRPHPPRRLPTHHQQRGLT